MFPPSAQEPAKPIADEAPKPQQPTQLYFYKTKDGEKGPYTVGQLRSLWTNGQITADADYRSENSAEWSPLAASPILSVSGLAQSIPPMRAIHSLALKSICLLSVIAFFLTTMTLSVPIFGNVDVSMFDFLTPRSQDASSEQKVHKPKIKNAFDSEDSFQLKKANAGAIICAIAALGLLLHYLLTFVWGVFVSFAWQGGQGAEKLRKRIRHAYEYQSKTNGPRS